MKNNKSVLMTISFFVIALLIPFSAYAIFAKLSTNLTATATINNMTPKGKAYVDQSSYPSKPGTLSINIYDINLADGTKMDVYVSDCSPNLVATLVISGKRASLKTALPSSCQVGRLATITVNNPYSGTSALKGGNPWSTR